MRLEKIALLSSFKERLYCWVTLSCILIVILTFKYFEYKHFLQEEFIKVKVEVVNLYEKENYNVLRLKHDDFTLFTSVNSSFTPVTHELYNVVILTSNIGFIEYLKGFYTKSMLYEPITNNSFKSTLNDLISFQHENQTINRFYQALFLAQPLPNSLRDFFANLGISHLIAISGFHLSVLSLCLYFVLAMLYKPIHQYFMPYRHRKFDILVVIVIILFFYLLLTDFVPSLLRAFLMMVFALILLRNNIELFSYETLLLTLGCIIAFFPEYIFSIALWFSISAVFYIFLFLQYFKNQSKIIMLVGFNMWIFLIFNPIVHFFFANTSYEQLLSPIITMLFTLFYPLVLLLHLISQGYLLDSLLIQALSLNINSFEVSTPWWFFVLYVVVSIGAIFKKEAFILLNILMVLFNLYLFV